MAAAKPTTSSEATAGGSEAAPQTVDASSPVATEAVAEPKLTDQAPQGKLKISVTNGIDARFRAGRKFTRTPTELDASEFTQQQLADLRADKYLKVEEVA